MSPKLQPPNWSVVIVALGASALVLFGAVTSLASNGPHHSITPVMTTIATSPSSPVATSTPPRPLPLSPTLLPHPDLDPRFDTCAEVKAHGYGPYHRGADQEYTWYRDSDGDGIVCE